jgi:hypothetical protein
MYDLTLDGSTMFWWFAMFVPIVAMLLIAISFLFIVAQIKRAAWWQWVAPIVLALMALGGLYHTTISPFWYYRRELEPSIVRAEEVFRRYELYREQHGTYPATPDAIEFPQLDYFDSVAGWRDAQARCNPGREGCTGLRIQTQEAILPDGSVMFSEPAQPGPGDLVVIVFDGLFRCEITNLERDWRCRDMR